MEIYKDANSNLSNVNPVSIEQKMALIEVINGRLIPKALSDERNISADIQKLNASKLKKLQKHMEGLDLSSKLTRADLNNFAADLMFILKGPPVSLFDYFTSNKTARMNERLMRMVQEDILLIGLKGMVDRIPEKNAYTRLENFRYKVKIFFQLKMWKFLILPYDLPWFDQVKIPEELLEKIIVDGLQAHEQELAAHLKKQGMIDHYERFRKVYRPIAFSIGFYLYYERWNNKMGGKLGENQEQEKKVFMDDIEALSSVIMEETDISVKTDDMLKKEQLQRLLKISREKNKNEPSKDEYKQLYEQVYR